MGTRRGLGTGAARLALLGPVVAAGLLFAAAPASAHKELIGTDPPAGAVLDAAAPAVTFTYSATIAGAFAEAAVTPPGGTEVRLDGDQLIVDADSVSVPIADLALTAPPGVWSVVVRVVAADGHPVDSATQFTVAAAGASGPVTAPVPAVPPGADPEAPAAPSAVNAATAAGSPPGAAAPDPSSIPAATIPAATIPAATIAAAAASPPAGGWSPGTSAALIIAAVAVVGGAGAFALARRG